MTAEKQTEKIGIRRSTHELNMSVWPENCNFLILFYTCIDRDRRLCEHSPLILPLDTSFQPSAAPAPSFLRSAWNKTHLEEARTGDIAGIGIWMKCCVCCDWCWQAAVLEARESCWSWECQEPRFEKFEDNRTQTHYSGRCKAAHFPPDASPLVSKHYLQILQSIKLICCQNIS